MLFCGFRFDLVGFGIIGSGRPVKEAIFASSTFQQYTNFSFSMGLSAPLLRSPVWGLLVHRPSARQSRLAAWPFPPFHCLPRFVPLPLRLISTRLQPNPSKIPFLSPSLPSSLVDLADPRIRAYVTARVVRKWKTILRGASEPITTDLIVTDEKGNAMHVVIPEDVLPELECDVVEGLVYKMLRFQVVPAQGNYKPVAGRYNMLFHTGTDLELIEEDLDRFPRYFFKCATMNEIKQRKPKEEVLTNVAGMLLSITEVIPVQTGDGSLNKKRYSDQAAGLRVTFWEKHMDKLDLTRLLNQRIKPIVVLAGIIVSSYRDTKFLATSSAAQVYVDPDIKETRLIRERFVWDRTPVLLITAAEADATQAWAAAQETVIDELIHLTPDQIGTTKYNMEAMVMDVSCKNGWYYEACPKCWLKMTRPDEATLFKCGEHGVEPPKLVAKLSLKLRDHTTRLSATSFGGLAAGLLGSGSDVAVVDTEIDKFTLPSSAINLIGKTFVFTLGITKSTVKRGTLRFKVFAYTPKEDPVVEQTSLEGKEVVMALLSQPASPQSQESLQPLNPSVLRGSSDVGGHAMELVGEGDRAPVNRSLNFVQCDSVSAKGNCNIAFETPVVSADVFVGDGCDVRKIKAKDVSGAPLSVFVRDQKREGTHGSSVKFVQGKAGRSSGASKANVRKMDHGSAKPPADSPTKKVRESVEKLQVE
ncbi:Nucleic acid-binding protein [Corchorus olitorius]|uniref:Nucleic acid-binding protein n=1 Tax=Corchorus olitorius TaxID=93759 RepID=A0A1R3L4K5_9ROSI|nr:Nucleic acid-binding protein [Corchorus olitorius]